MTLDMKYFITLLYFIALASCVSKDNKVGNSINSDTLENKIIGKPITFNLTGNWKYQDSSSSFNLELIQLQDSIKGNYCAIAYNGNKIDCYVDDADDCSLRGQIIDSIININFKSCYVGAVGQATVKYDFKTDKLFWTLGKVDNEVYAPDTATLTRINKTSRYII